MDCEHCNAPIRGRAYRVLSRDGGETLLNMVVCFWCCLEAKRLKLEVEEITAEAQPARPMRGVTPRA